MAGLFDDVIGDAIAVAVRRACDDVGRAPYGSSAAATSSSTSATSTPTPTSSSTGKAPPDVDDPDAVLGIAHGASWERITAAHRRLARLWHPDGADEDEREMREDLIRRLNAAGAELRIRPPR